MQPQTETKFILIIRETRLDELIRRFNTMEQAQFYVEHLGADFSDYQQEHTVYKAAIRDVETFLSRLGRVQVLQRSFLPNFVFGPHDVVIVVGQDGLVANTLKYLDGQAVVAVNPDPERWDGVLLPFVVADVPTIIPDLIGQKREVKRITMAKAELNDGQVLYGVNDLFIGPQSHVSARYALKVGDHLEQQVSSGIIVSTGLGSTGWLKSVRVGALSIAGKLTHQTMDEACLERVPWNASHLYYAVREPFPSQMSCTSLVFGKITCQQPLSVVSQMPGNGVIFSDGIESDFITFNSGTEAKIAPADKKGYLVV